MPNATDTSDEEDRGDEKGEVPNMLKRVYNFFFKDRAAVWTAIFTGVLTLFTYKMYDVSRVANETTRSSERAFVSFSGFQMGPRMRDEGNKWMGDQVFTNWINSGTTPAKNLVIQTNAKPWPIGEDLPASYEFPLSPEKSRGVMAPKGGYQNPRIIPSALLDDSWHGKARLFFWGTMLYDDIFPNDPERLTEFCVEISQITVGKPASPAITPQVSAKANPKAPTVVEPPPGLDIKDLSDVIAGFTFQPCAEHNCYDEDCKDYKERVETMRK